MDLATILSQQLFYTKCELKAITVSLRLAAYLNH